MTFNFYADPGHGWLKVPRVMLIAHDLIQKISSYSYQRGAFVYLEEDCDLHTFVVSLKAAGIKVEYRDNVTNRRSKIRSYDYYRKIEEAVV